MEHKLEELAREAGELLGRHRIKLVTAESCTGGWIAEAMTSVAGSSRWFEGGLVTYSNTMKQNLLEVDPDVLAHKGAVSEEVVLQMARGAVKLTGAHLSVAVSGIAGPDGGTPDKPVGTVWIAWGQKRGYAEAQLFEFRGGRRQVRLQAATAALEGVIARLR